MSIGRSRTLAVALTSVAAAVGVVVGSASPAVAAPEQKTMKDDPFPTILADRGMAPSSDSSGKPSPWNSIVWDHVTVLTHTQTVLARDSGVLPVVQQVAPEPYSELAGMARYVLPFGASLINAGGCLALFWQDEPFTAPDGRQRQAFVQVFAKSGCYA